MIRLTLKEIIEATGGELLAGSLKNSVRGLSIDSRTIRDGEYFIAIKGKNFDGHDFIDDALEKGAGGIIAEKEHERSIHGEVKNLLLVDNGIRAMGSIAELIRTHINIPVFCITGTNGKTTTKDFITQILSARYNVHKSPESYNNLIGLSLTMFTLDHAHDALVLELGTNHPGEISRLAEISRPQVAIFTNIGDGHLEAFVDRQGVFVEKTSVLDLLPPEGLAILNRDDAFLCRTSVRGVAKKFYGMDAGSDFRIANVVEQDDGYIFKVNDEEYFAPIEGVHNIYNVAAAIAASKHMGLEYDEIKEQVSRLEMPKMRLEKVAVNNVLFINDSYNSNPSSFECALDVLLNSSKERTKIVVAGDMMELGDTAEEFHRMIGRSIAGKNIDYLITMGQMALHTQEGAMEFGMDKERVMSAAGHEHAAMLLEKLSAEDTVVLLKGSRNSRMEEVLKCFTTCSTR